MNADHFAPARESKTRESESGPSVIMLSGRKFLVGCAVVAGILLLLGRHVTMPTWLLATEVFATIIGLFVFGSFKYQIHKNALTYGMSLIIIATFCGIAGSPWHIEIARDGWWAWIKHNLLSFHGLDDLVHADTMIFILGLTFFVSVIAQTRLLEGITFFLLRGIPGRDSSYRYLGNCRRGRRFGNPRRRLNDRADDPHACHYSDACRRSDCRGPICCHGLHGGHDDLRHLVGLWGAAKPDHEGQSPSAISTMPFFCVTARPPQSLVIS